MSIRLGPGPQADTQRSLLRAIELLNSDSPDSSEQILILLRKAQSEHAASRPAGGPNVSGGDSGGTGPNLSGAQAGAQRAGSMPTAASRGRGRPPLKKKSRLDMFRGGK
eukprot:jgi/Tetstr1/424913/TSEL_015407.t1